MNEYGLMAMDYWELHAPRQYQELTDPTEFFTQLGEELADEIDQMAELEERQLPPNLSYSEKAVQLALIKRQAEEIVLYERVWSLYEPIMDAELHLEAILNELPSPEMLTKVLDQMTFDVELRSEEAGLKFGYTTEEEAYRDRVLQVKELLLQAENPELSWEERIEAAEQANKQFLILDA